LIRVEPETWRKPVKNPEFEVILARAIANEESAAAFYRQAAARIADPVTKDVLEELMRDEVEHRRLLLAFRRGERPLPAGPANVGAGLVEYLGAPDFTPEMSPAEAFLLAARKEQLAVEFYERWAALYPAGPERELLLGLAGVERRHREKVENLYTNAAFPEAW